VEIGWELTLNGAPVVTVANDLSGWRVAHAGDETGLFSSVEDAVRASPAARALDRPGRWVIATTLDTFTVLDLLDEPSEGVEEVVINDDVFSVLADGDGRYLFHPDFWPPEDAEETNVLSIGLKSPGFGSPGGSPAYADWVKRTRGVYRLTSSEDMVFDDVDPSPYPSDLEATRTLLREVEGPVISFVWYGQPELAGAEIADLISKVNCPYGVVWFDDELWRSGPPSTRVIPGPVARLPSEPTRATCQIADHRWVADALGAQQPPDALGPDAWWAVLMPSEAELGLLLAADFCYGDGEDSADRDVVVVEFPTVSMFGLKTWSDELICRHASLLAGVPVAGDDSRFCELAGDGSVLRSWAWHPKSVDPPSSLGRIHAAWSVIEDVSL